MSYNLMVTPSLLLDVDIMARNIARMQERMESLGVSLRPHMKTHKCIEIGTRQRDAGARGITVSTFPEAVAFAHAGFKDITWAFPLPPVYALKAAELAETCTFRVVVDSMDAKEHLDKAARATGASLHVWLKVDCGYHRAGVDPRSPEAEKLVKALSNSKTLLFDGIMSHSGHAYHGHTTEEILEVARSERDVMLEFAEEMRSKGYTIPAISIGSTPAMSVIDSLDGIDEVRPGNYVFYDYTMAMLGVCGVEDCALTVLASVISHQPNAHHVVTDAGALALPVYEDYGKKRLYAHLHMGALSQEHGKLIATDKTHLQGKFHVGERVRILEHHSCLTAAQFDQYIVVKDGDIVDRWNILRGRTS
jgi:D-serine deaminase-like pyridoxal phosphate-dependent protein